MQEAKFTVSVGGEGSSFDEWAEAIAKLDMPPDMARGFADMAVIGKDETAPWLATVTWDLDADDARPVAVELRAQQGQQVTAEAWRAVNVGSIIRETRARLRYVYQRISDRLDYGDAAALATAGRSALEGQPRRGRPPVYDDAHFERVAAIYNGAAKTPVRAVAEVLAGELRDPHILKDNRAKTWVREARRRGLIGERKRNDG